MMALRDHWIELTLLVPFAICVWGLRKRPRVAVFLWALALVLVPVWVAVHVGELLLSASVVASATLLFVTIGRETYARPMDVAIALFLILIVLSTAVGTGRWQEVFEFVMGPLTAYLVGRTITNVVNTDFLYKLFGFLFVAVSVLAIIESITGINAFLGWGPENSLDSWSTQQSRGGETRPEVAFGHSIALGASLAMTVPLVWAARWPAWWRALALILIFSAAVLSLSRIGMATSLLALIVMAVFSKHRLSIPHALIVLAIIVPVMAAVLGSIQDVFERAGSEATSSSEYRASLRRLIPSIRWLGVAESEYYRADGRRYFGAFSSIDSQLLFTGLLYGIIPLAILVIPLVLSVFVVLQGRASAPLIAVVCQIPALLNVALITQYGTYFWFLVGLAATVPIAQSKQDLWVQAPRVHRIIGATDAPIS